MTHNEFNLILSARIDQMQKVLGSKAEEYANDADRLHNFKEAARINECTIIEAWRGMVIKHEVSVRDMLKSGGVPSPHWIDEKIGDMINYLVLLEAIYYEQLATSPEDRASCKWRNGMLDIFEKAAADG